MYWVSVPLALAKYFVKRMLTLDLLAVANLLIVYSDVSTANYSICFISLLPFRFLGRVSE